MSFGCFCCETALCLLLLRGFQFVHGIVSGHHPLTNLVEAGQIGMIKDNLLERQVRLGKRRPQPGKEECAGNTAQHDKPLMSCNRLEKQGHDRPLEDDGLVQNG